MPQAYPEEPYLDKLRRMEETGSTEQWAATFRKPYRKMAFLYIMYLGTYDGRCLYKVGRTSQPNYRMYDYINKYKDATCLWIGHVADEKDAQLRESILIRRFEDAKERFGGFRPFGREYFMFPYDKASDVTNEEVAWAAKWHKDVEGLVFSGDKASLAKERQGLHSFTLAIPRTPLHQEQQQMDWGTLQYEYPKCHRCHARD